ncbi:MAG: serine/threonine protein kinase [Bacilli bacterium]|nr:serine/threonine protein kinase [Bacilli bacterium]
MILPLHTLIYNRYIPTRYIASGGMAEIYEANDTYSHKPVAIKVIKEEYKDDLFELDRFKNEARYVSMFSHPHIINIFNVGKYNDNFFIVYELLSGKTLKECLDERGHLSVEEAINFMLQILDATKHIHERGVVHNDLKPDNMFLFYDGNIKLLDFGIATHIGERDLEKANASILYASPEVLRNKDYSVKSDLYSLGIILYELLSGRTPYMKDNTEEEIKAHIYEEVPSLNKYIHLKNGKDFDYIIKKCTNHDLTKRYRNDQEMINDLKKIKEGEPLKKKSIFERLFEK